MTHLRLIVTADVAVVVLLFLMIRCEQALDKREEAPAEPQFGVAAAE